MKGEGWVKTTFDLKTVEKDDVLSWTDDPWSTDVTLELRDGVPLSEHISLGAHFGVYEGNGLVSDLVIDGDAYAPRIRVRSLEHMRKPDFIHYQKEDA